MRVTPKRFKKVDRATAMIWKLLMVAESNFRLLDGAAQLRDVHAGRPFVDGKLVVEKQGEVRHAA